MEVKFNKELNKYDYILSFDLAKHKTGWSLISLFNLEIIDCGLIETSREGIEVWLDFYNKLHSLFSKFKQEKIKFFVIKERLPNQNGIRSSIAALQELAKVHAIFDLLVLKEEIDYYDENGIHSISVKSFYKNKYGIDKPSKIDIENFIKLEHPEIAIKGYNTQKWWSTDITDSMAIIFTLMGKRWNGDIEEEIKLLKKKIKSLKREKDINIYENRINFLLSLKI